MEDHHDHETKPKNRWIAPPILGAVIVIALVVCFISFASGQCCGGDCCESKNKNEHGTEQHDATHGNEHETPVSNVDTTASTSDTNAVEEHEGHGDHDH